MDIHRCSFIDYTPESITCSAFTHESNLEDFSPQNFRLALGRSDGTIEIWNPHNSRSKWVLENVIPGSKGSSIEGLVWSSKNDPSLPPRLFSIGGSTILTEWDLSTGIPLKNYDCNAGVIWSITINSQHNKIALGCDDGSVVVVSINGGPGVIEHECILQRQKYRVLSLCWTNNHMILGGCADGRIRCWSYHDSLDESNIHDNTSLEANSEHQIINGRLIQTLRIDKSKGEPSLIWCLLYLPASNQFVSGDSTGSIKIWDLKHLVLQQSLQVHEADVLCLSKDALGEKFFSAGVDRKIHSFNYTKLAKNDFKWINTSSRLLHGNDVRTMTCYQSKNLDFLVSGGIERIMHINSVVNFQSSVSFKLPINPLNENIKVHSERRLIIMWQKNEVKIWRLKVDHTKRLVAKLTLADPENITDVDISENGEYLVVSRLSIVKLFRLTEESENKLLVKRVDSDLLSSVGAKQSKFIRSQDLILVYTSDNDLLGLRFDQSSPSSPIDDFQEPIDYDLPDTDLSNSTFEYISHYNHIAVDNRESLVALAKCNGVIDILDLKTCTTSTFVTLSSVATAISFTSSSTLIAVTLDHKIHEFDVLNGKKNGQIYTPWSMKNSNRMPDQFLSFQGYALGLFEILGKFYVYGTNWLAIFDTSVNLPNKTALLENKKRSRNGTNVAISPSKPSLAEENKGFWSTKNYSDLLFVGRLNESELVVVERHLEDMTNPPAFKLNKISI
ncbi:hypothetical protein CANINC_000247 [Pichia inconspicua]|uniref:Uncharacterized protein n=1 Tax=Pichia inconspicua TaxID=52247 RepID=A0A4T0X6R8_9ASCO|nr:hypothetical protein CANINC_000247 [[Candida] inconspicua]